MADVVLCAECGLDVESRAHQEGLNGIHDAPASPPVAEEDGTAPAVDEAPAKRLADMNKADLLELAEGRGVDVSEAKNNDQIRELLRAAEAVAWAGGN